MKNLLAVTALIVASLSAFAGTTTYNFASEDLGISGSLIVEGRSSFEGFPRDGAMLSMKEYVESNFEEHRVKVATVVIDSFEGIIETPITCDGIISFVTMIASYQSVGILYDESVKIRTMNECFNEDGNKVYSGGLSLTLPRYYSIVKQEDRWSLGSLVESDYYAYDPLLPIKLIFGGIKEEVSLPLNLEYNIWDNGEGDVRLISHGEIVVLKKVKKEGTVRFKRAILGDL